MPKEKVKTDSEVIYWHGEKLHHFNVQLSWWYGFVSSCYSLSYYEKKHS